MQLDIALSTLNGKITADELHFWGKINGLNNDYYIAVGICFEGMYEFPVKRFYWALSTDFAFKEMPALGEQHDAKINADISYFTGEPNKNLLAKADGEEGEQEEPPVEENNEEGEEGDNKKADKDSDESEEEEIKAPKRDLTGKYKDVFLI